MNRPKIQVTPEQKANMVNQIETDRKSGMSLSEAIAKQDIGVSLYTRWRKQLAVGIHSALRNNKAPFDAARRSLERKVKKLREAVFS